MIYKKHAKWNPYVDSPGLHNITLLLQLYGSTKYNRLNAKTIPLFVFTSNGQENISCDHSNQHKFQYVKNFRHFTSLYLLEIDDIH